jgi:hypothetical protein
LAARADASHQALDEATAAGMAGEKARHRIRVGPATGRIAELRPKELEQFLGRPRDEPLDGVAEDVIDLSTRAMMVAPLGWFMILRSSPHAPRCP